VTKIIELDINEINTKFVATNSCVLVKYAKNIESSYNNKTGFFTGFGIGDFLTYHVFKRRLNMIAWLIDWKSIIAIDNNTYEVINAYIGIKDKLKINRVPRGWENEYDIMWNGINTEKWNRTEEFPEKVKYILEVKKYKGEKR